jgi:aspartyl-tRNA(Asn)/glutamyl-tRNA(Gln) amidotransferase subunit B
MKDTAIDKSYEPVIGLEVHAQLLTHSKIFCGCSTAFGKEANGQTCPVCLGLPGVLPVLNRRVVEFAIKAGLATHSEISSYSRFARKNYFYPDLPKGYQISQYELPIVRRGYLEIVVDGQVKRVGLTRIHMEEDAGKNLHEGISGASHLDLNRAGVPLLEVVSEPDIRSSGEAVAYLKSLRDILVYLEICDGNMEEGSFRCDANVSLRPVGEKGFGTRVEVKNMNSFRFVQKALEYEIKRQERVLQEEGRVIQETRLWDPHRGVTVSMRSKEEAHDYRYFPEPDLVPLEVDVVWIEEIKKGLPELPHAKRARFVADYGLPDYDARVLTATRALADYFEACVRLYRKPKAVSNWIMTEVLRVLKEGGRGDSPFPAREEPFFFKEVMPPERLIGLLKLIDQGTVSNIIAKSIFEEMVKTPGVVAEAMVQEKGVAQVSDEGVLADLVDQVIAAHPKEVMQYRQGKEKLFGFLVGQVMKASQGKANPSKVNELLLKRLKVQGV